MSCIVRQIRKQKVCPLSNCSWLVQIYGRKDELLSKFLVFHHTDIARAAQNLCFVYAVSRSHRSRNSPKSRQSSLPWWNLEGDKAKAQVGCASLDCPPLFSISLMHLSCQIISMKSVSTVISTSYPSVLNFLMHYLALCTCINLNFQPTSKIWIVNGDPSRQIGQLIYSIIPRLSPDNEGNTDWVQIS